MFVFQPLGGIGDHPLGSFASSPSSVITALTTLLLFLSFFPSPSSCASFPDSSTPSPPLNSAQSSGGTDSMTAPPWHEEGPMPTISDSLFSLIILIYVGVIFVFMFFSFCWKEPDPPPPSSCHKDIPMITEMILEQEKKEAEEASAAETEAAAAAVAEKLELSEAEKLTNGVEQQEGPESGLESALAAAGSPNAAVAASSTDPPPQETEMKEMLLLPPLPPANTGLVEAANNSPATDAVIVNVVTEKKLREKVKAPPMKTDVSTQVEGKTVATQV